MVYVDLHCRLGNQMFQLAAGATLANLNNTKMVCCVCPTEFVPGGRTLREYTKQFEDNIFCGITFVDSIPDGIQHLYWSQFEYKPFPKIETDVVITGAFQSWKYLDESIVRELFKMPEYINQQIKLKYGDNLSNVTAVHIRRGDYLPIPHKFPVMSLGYFQKAIKEIDSEKYLIISDDILWCKKQFIGEQFLFSDGGDALEDLFLISSCQNVIMSNSSFSWWGAYLNANPEKIVIAPKNWFGWSKETRIHKVKDLLPPSWKTQYNIMEWKPFRRALWMSIKEILLDVRDSIKKRK